MELKVLFLLRNLALLVHFLPGGKKTFPSPVFQVPEWNWKELRAREATPHDAAKREDLRVPKTFAHGPFPARDIGRRVYNLETKSDRIVLWSGTAGFFKPWVRPEQSVRPYFLCHFLCIRAVWKHGSFPNALQQRAVLSSVCFPRKKEETKQHQPPLPVEDLSVRKLHSHYRVPAFGWCKSGHTQDSEGASTGRCQNTVCMCENETVVRTW